MDLYSALSLRVYEILELEPPNGKLPGRPPLTVCPTCCWRECFWWWPAPAGEPQIPQPLWRLFAKRRRQFSRQQRDEDAMESSRVPELYDRIGREKTADSSWKPAEQQEGAEQ